MRPDRRALCALALALAAPRARVNALMLAVAPALTGIAGEAAKLLIRRERPMANAGQYVFRSWAEHTFSTAGLAMPSSHAIVAFGAAFALAHMYPRARWVWYAIALACALTRVISRAHYASDIVLAAVVAWPVVEIMFAVRMPGRRRQRAPVN